MHLEGMVIRIDKGKLKDLPAGGTSIHGLVRHQRIALRCCCLLNCYIGVEREFIKYSFAVAIRSFFTTLLLTIFLIADLEHAALQRRAGGVCFQNFERNLLLCGHRVGAERKMRGEFLYSRFDKDNGLNIGTVGAGGINIISIYIHADRERSAQCLPLHIHLFCCRLWNTEQEGFAKCHPIFVVIQFIILLDICQGKPL